MLNKSDSGVYYLNKSDEEKIENNDLKNSLESLLELRNSKEEAIDYYLNILEENLKEYKSRYDEAFNKGKWKTWKFEIC